MKTLPTSHKSEYWLFQTPDRAHTMYGLASWIRS